MSIPNLPVDFKDDILASSNTKRKYRQTTNGDSTVSFEDVTNYSQKGSEFGAKEVNQTNTAINNIYDERVLDVDALELITEPGFFVDAQVVKELNGKMKADDDWSAYSNNGWTINYRHIASNFIYMTAQKTSPGNNQAITNSLVAAGLPFKAAFDQSIPCSMEVAGNPVGHGRARIATNNGMYLCASAYGSDVTYMVYGLVTVE